MIEVLCTAMIVLFILIWPQGLIKYQAIPKAKKAIVRSQATAAQNKQTEELKMQNKTMLNVGDKDLRDIDISDLL